MSNRNFYSLVHSYVCNMTLVQRCFLFGGQFVLVFLRKSYFSCWRGSYIGLTKLSEYFSSTLCSYVRFLSHVSIVSIILRIFSVMRACFLICVWKLISPVYVSRSAVPIVFHFSIGLDSMFHILTVILRVCCLHQLSYLYAFCWLETVNVSISGMSYFLKCCM